MGELGALFNPGMRHELEERQAKAARREEEGNARDGDLRIDLESGVAVINIPGDDGELPATEDSAASSNDAAKDSSAADSSPVDTAPAGSDDAPVTVEGAQSEDAAVPPPAVRPRGKRGLSATHR